MRSGAYGTEGTLRSPKKMLCEFPAHPIDGRSVLRYNVPIRDVKAHGLYSRERCSFLSTEADTPFSTSSL